MLSSIINKEIFNCYVCNGTFLFDDKEFSSEFYLIQYNDGTIDLIIVGIYTFLFIERYNVEDNYCSIFARLINGSAIVKIDEAVISNFSVNFGNGKPTYAILNVYKPVIIESDNNGKNLDQNVLLVYLTNFLNNPTKQGEFEKFNIENDDYLIEFEGIHNYNEYKTLLYERKEDILITSMAKINLKNKDIDIIEEINRLTYLISYINRTQISPVCFDFFENEYLIKSILYPVHTTKFSNKDKLIEPRNMKYFIEKCYDEFKEKLTKLSLKISISIYLESMLGNYVDTNYILLIQALEVFLASYEDLWVKKGNEIKLGSIRKVKKDISQFMQSKEYPITEEDLNEISEKLAYKFTTTLDKLTLIKKQDNFKDNLNLNEYDYDFPTIRNKIIHEGIVPASINSSGSERKINILEEYKRVIFMFDKIILILVGYDGEFHDYLNEKFITFN